MCLTVGTNSAAASISVIKTETLKRRWIQAPRRRCESRRSRRSPPDELNLRPLYICCLILVVGVCCRSPSSILIKLPTKVLQLGAAHAHNDGPVLIPAVAIIHLLEDLLFPKLALILMESCQLQTQWQRE